MTAGMKVRDSLKVSVIRMVRSSVKNREIEFKRDLDDSEVTEVIGSLVKQRRESIKMFEEAGRDDLVEKERRELSLLLTFLPQQLERPEIEEIVEKAVTESGASGPRDIGKVMKVLMPKVSGRADGKLVNDIVKEKLSR
jgi:uncharacterized protein YqeY